MDILEQILSSSQGQVLCLGVLFVLAVAAFIFMFAAAIFVDIDYHSKE